MFLNELNILPAVLRQIFIFFDSADVAFPSRQSLQNRFCFLKQCSCRKFCCYFSINLISCADRNFIQISKNIKNCESNICSSLKTASVFGSNTVKPSHTSWTACSSTKFTAVTATSSQFICFIAKDFRNKCTCSYCTGVCLAYSNNLFDLIWWKTCSYCTISCQGRGRCNHRINSMIRVFQRTKLSLKKNFFTFF